MKLIFYYVSYKAGLGIISDLKNKSNNYYANRVTEEGYFDLLKKTSELKYVDEVIIIIESLDGPGTIEISDKIKIKVVPDIEQSRQFIKQGDVLWVRGGWKHWHDFFINRQKEGHWCLIYAANTGRQKWPFWDVVLDDLSGNSYFDVRKRLIYDFRKSISETIFKVIPDTPLKYDICIGASRVHDKKGQWRVVEALAAYARDKNRRFKAVLPGPWAHGVKTNAIKRLISGNSLNIKITESLTRPELAQVMNESKLFIHLGSHGQGDRGVMEALACGCNIMIGYKEYHAPWIFKNDSFVSVPRNPNNFSVLGQAISVAVLNSTRYEREDIAKFYYDNAGLEKKSFPRFKFLLDFFNEFPIRKENLLFERLGTINE